MRCVVDNAQSEFFRDSLQRSDRTRQAIDVNAENACCAGCHEAFNSNRVDRHSYWIDVGKNWRDPAPLSACGVAGNVNGVVMTSPRQIQCLAGGHECRRAVVKERDLWRLEIGTQEVLKGAGLGARNWSVVLRSKSRASVRGKPQAAAELGG